MDETNNTNWRRAPHARVYRAVWGNLMIGSDHALTIDDIPRRIRPPLQKQRYFVTEAQVRYALKKMQRHGDAECFWRYGHAYDQGRWSKIVIGYEDDCQ